MNPKERDSGLLLLPCKVQNILYEILGKPHSGGDQLGQGQEPHSAYQMHVGFICCEPGFQIVKDRPLNLTSKRQQDCVAFSGAKECQALGDLPDLRAAALDPGIVGNIGDGHTLCLALGQFLDDGFGHKHPVKQGSQQMEFPDPEQVQERRCVYATGSRHFGNPFPALHGSG